MCFGQQPFVGLRHLNVLVATEVAPYRHWPKTTSKMISLFPMLVLPIAKLVILTYINNSRSFITDGIHLMF